MKQGWEIKKLGEVITLEYGKPLPDKRRDLNGAYPVYGANGVKGRSNEFYQNKKTIIVGRKGSAGEINLSEEKFWALDVTYFVTFDEKKYDLMFLYHLLNLLELPKLAKGVKPGINRNEVYSLDTQLPPLPEQQRIVAILDEAFAAIAKAKANAEQNLKNARELFECFLHSMFFNKGEDWDEKKLGEVATFRNGMNFTKGSKGEVIKIVGVKDFQTNFWVPFENLEYVTIDGELNEIDSLKKDDILTVRSNGNPELIGRTLLAGNFINKVSHSGFTIRIRLNSKNILPIYLCHYLKTLTTRRVLIESGTGVNIKSLNQIALSSLLIPFPPLSTQNSIVQKIYVVSAETKKLESIYQKQITHLEELKKSVLQKAFNGELKTIKAISV